MLTPADIDSKRFTTTRLKEGYDQEDVDDFLDRLQEDYKFALAQTARLEEENRVLRRKLESASNAPTAELAIRPDPPSVVAEKLLEAAQQAHDAHVADGRAKADDIVRDAGAEGARLVEEAAAAAERIKSEGLAEKYRRNEELDKKASLLEKTVSDLNYRGEQVSRALREALAKYEKEMTL